MSLRQILDNFSWDTLMSLQLQSGYNMADRDQINQVIDHLIEIREEMEKGSWLLVAIAFLLGVIAWKLFF